MRKSTFVILCCFFKINILVASSITLVDLTCENLSHPNGIDHTTPHFSWKIRSDRPMQQQYYEIQVASDSLKLVNNSADLWNSAKVPSPASVMVPYQGRALKSRMLGYWRVRVWDDKGKSSIWSPIQRFGIGILAGDQLRGNYIGLSAGAGDVRSPLLRKTFSAANSGTTFLHVNSLGYHEVFINGKKVGNQVLAPSVSQLNKRSLIVTYDVTPYLQKGKNELILWLGQGWYKKTTFGTAYDGPLVNAEMETLLNGNWQPVLATDTSWQGRESGYSDTGTWMALQFGGEKIDRRVLPDNLSPIELSKLRWFPVVQVSIPGDHIASPQMSEPDKVQDTIIPRNIKSLGGDSWLIDMGKVLTGWFELHAPQLPEGHEIVVKYSDNLTKDGTLDDQGQSDLYISSGNLRMYFAINSITMLIATYSSTTCLKNLQRSKSGHILSMAIINLPPHSRALMPT